MSISLLGNFITIVNNQTPNKKRSNTIAMYMENESGGYDLSSQNKFPTEGYVLNTERALARMGGNTNARSDDKKVKSKRIEQ